MAILKTLLFFFLLLGVPSSPVGPLEVSDIQRNSVTLKWQPPESDGGSPIKGYVIEKRDAKRATWVNAGQVNSATTEFVADRLQEGGEYLFRVIAENKVGSSKPLELDTAAVPKSPFGELCPLSCLKSDALPMVGGPSCVLHSIIIDDYAIQHS